MTCKHGIEHATCDFCAPRKVTVPIRKVTKPKQRYEWVVIVSGGAPSLGKRR